MFNNAGYQGYYFEMAHNYDVEDFKKVLDTNVIGVFNVFKAAANHMIKNNIKGSIVNTASKAATNCPPNMQQWHRLGMFDIAGAGVEVPQALLAALLE